MASALQSLPGRMPRLRRLRLGTAPLSPLLLLSTVCSCATAPTVPAPYTLAVSPLASPPAAGAGIDDQRGRFREILCAVTEAHGHELPEHRPCGDILHRFADEPPGTGEPVQVGPGQSKLRVAVVAGLGAECFAGLVSTFQFALEHLQGLGYHTASIRVDGLSSSTNNGRQIRDAVVAMDLAPDERLVLVGYSKGTPDILEGLVTYPELAQRVAAVVSVAGAVNGSPLADDASASMLTLLKYLPGSGCDEGDGGALDSLKPSVRRDFAGTHELPGTVRYYSVATFTRRELISIGLSVTYDQLANIDPRNDGQMLFYDQIIAGGALLGFVNADHWAVALPVSRTRPGLAATLINRNEFPREALLEAIVRHVEERLPAVPPRSLESGLRLRGQARRRHARADAEPSPTMVLPLGRA
jgi:pimeloyl-ACP methyl ester carboxylesterase